MRVLSRFRSSDMKIRKILNQWSLKEFLQIKGIKLFCKVFSRIDNLRIIKAKITKKMIKILLNNKKLKKIIKNYNTIIIVPSIKEYKVVEKELKNLLILGCCVKNVFFLKQDINCVSKIKILEEVFKFRVRLKFIIKIIIIMIKSK